MINVTSSGSTTHVEEFLMKMNHGSLFTTLNEYGQIGRDALAAATPVKSGRTAESWYYKVTSERGFHSITWYNSNEDDDGVPIVILLQYGHGTRGGGFVQGHDFINPVIKPLFDTIADEVWKEVMNG